MDHSSPIDDDPSPAAGGDGLSASPPSVPSSTVLINDDGIIIEIPDEVTKDITKSSPEKDLPLSVRNNNNNNNVHSPHPPTSFRQSTRTTSKSQTLPLSSSVSSSFLPSSSSPDTVLSIAPGAPSPTESNLVRTSSNNATLMLPPFLRQLSSTTTLQKTFYCEICLEQKPINQSYQLSCSHRFCKQCLYEYLKAKIMERQVFLTCFAQHTSGNTTVSNSSPMEPIMVNRTPSSGSEQPPQSSSSNSSTSTTNNDNSRLVCAMPIRETDIFAILYGYSDGASLVEKYRRFAAESKNPNLRSCPYCLLLQEGKPSEPLMKCTNTVCGEEFCFSHSNAHIGGTCAEFESRHQEENRVNEAAIAQDTKPCPNCGIRISKLAGCNHMKCTTCGTSFCWLCGKKVEDSDLPTHFQFWNIMGCPNKQFNDTNGSWFQFFTTIVIFFLFGIPSILITTLFFIACPCICIPLAYTDNNGFSSFFMTIASVIMYVLILFLGLAIGIPIVVAVGVSMLPFLCCYACCAFGRSRAT